MSDKIICEICKKQYKDEKTFKMHFIRYHFKDLTAEKQADFEIKNSTSKLRNIPKNILTQYFIKLKEYNNLEKLYRNSFYTFYTRILIVRPFNCNTDFDIFFTKLLPWYKEHPLSGCSYKICSLIFDKEEDISKLLKYLKANNPGYQHDGSLSPFSKDFIGYKGLSSEDKEKSVRKATKHGTPGRTSNQKEYWLKYGYSLEEAEEMVAERQRTFSLEKCVKRYGEEEGRKRFNERQQKWQKTLNSKPLEEIIRINRAKFLNAGKNGYSIISQELFWEVYNQIKGNFSKIYFGQLNQETKDKETGTKNWEYIVQIDKKAYMLDFFVKDTKKVIEFDGDYWHQRTPDCIKKDELRDKVLMKAGYTIKRIKESNFVKNRKKIIKECIKFLSTK